jgi:hypothetical protein
MPFKKLIRISFTSYLGQDHIRISLLNSIIGVPIGKITPIGPFLSPDHLI